jgi:hypothetical protein
MKCPKCEKRFDDALVQCPFCETISREYNATQERERIAEVERISKGVIEKLHPVISKQVRREVYAGALALFGLLSTFAGIAVWEIPRKLQSTAQAEIAMRFNEATVRETFATVARTRAAELLNQQLFPEIEKARSETRDKIRLVDAQIKSAQSRYDSEIENLKSATEFSATSIDAQGDDRKAWDRLAVRGSDPGAPFSAEAGRLWASIMQEHGQAYFTSWEGSWAPAFGPEPSPLDLDAIVQRYSQLPPNVRQMFVSIMSQREDVSKSDRASFLVLAMHNDDSLRVVEYAARSFDRLVGMKEQYYPLYIKGRLDWWEQHNHRVDDALQDGGGQR